MFEDTQMRAETSGVFGSAHGKIGGRTNRCGRWVTLSIGRRLSPTRGRQKSGWMNALRQYMQMIVEHTAVFGTVLDVDGRCW